MFERLKSRWVLGVVILLVMGMAAAACVQVAPRLLPGLSASMGGDVNPEADLAIPVQVGGSTAATPGPGQAVVKSGSITDVVTLTGHVAGADETVITFPASGQVRVVSVKVGDTVRQGDILIETDSQDIKQQIIQAQGGLETASIRLDQARAQADADAQAQQSNAAQQQRDNASQRQALVSDAESALHRAQSNLDKVQAGPSDSDVRAAQAAVTTAHSASQRAETDLARLQRGADPTQVRPAQAQLDSAQVDFDKAQATVDSVTKGPDPAAVRSAQRDVDRAAALLKAAQAIPIDPKDPHADKTRADKDAAVASSQADLQAAQDRLSVVQQPPNPADVAAARGALGLAKTRLETARQALLDVQQGPDQTTLDQAQAAVDNAQLAEQNAIDHLSEVTSHPTLQELQVAQDQLKAARGAIDRANSAGASVAVNSTGNVSTSYNVVLLEKDVARNQALLDSLQRDLEASRLTAPFTGVVTRIQVHVDDKLTNKTPVLTLAKPGDAVFSVDLTAADTVKPTPGQAATVKLDNTDTTLEATVVTVQSANKGLSGRVAQFGVDWQGDTPPYGTLAQIQLQVNHKDGVLLVPRKALHTAGQRRYVQLQSGTGRKIVNVGVGIISSDSVEITNGLTEGQLVYVGP